MSTRRAGAIALALALLDASAAAQPPAPRVYDWCSAVVVRPDQHLEPGSCDPVWSADEIARGAEVVLLGDFRDVAEPVVPPRKDGCGRIESHAANAKRVAALRGPSRAPGLPPLEVVHEHRFELVSRPFAALPGFDAGFLLETRRPWQQVLDFFRTDRSAPCRASGCRWDDTGFGDVVEERGNRLRDLIDASAGPDAYQRKVYYVARGGPGQTLFHPGAALADLGNPAYRAWRVAEAKRALRVGGYSAVHLNQKLFQYAAPGGHWLGSASARDVAQLNQSGNTPWSAPPTGYGYAQYVAGWAALARDLRAAGVPYAVDLQGPELFDRADDPASAAHEGELIREVARNARLVLLDRYGFTSEGALRAVTADLEAHGARVVRIQSSCGYGRPGSG